MYERGYVDDGLEPERKLEICEDVSLILDLDGKDCLGFIFGALSEFDFEAPENAAVWSGPRFDVPALGIEQGTVGLIAATARLILGTLRTPDRVLFDAALAAGDREEALPLWEACLAEGNELARYAVGYTLLALDRPEEAHEQLKRYSALVRRNAWAWCYLVRRASSSKTGKAPSPRTAKRSTPQPPARSTPTQRIDFSRAAPSPRVRLRRELDGRA